MITSDSHYCWDLETIFDEIIIGLKKVCDSGLSVESIGVDSWGVDFVLLDENNGIIGKPIAYRDNRTNSIMEKVFQIIPKAKIYDKTGIQFMPFNTLFQLFAVKATHPEEINSAKTLLFLPDYINFLLSGNLITEYTIASTSQMLNFQKLKVLNLSLALLKWLY